jgi:hypothetical protein
LCLSDQGEVEARVKQHKRAPIAAPIPHASQQGNRDERRLASPSNPDVFPTSFTITLAGVQPSRIVRALGLEQRESVDGAAAFSAQQRPCRHLQQHPPVSLEPRCCYVCPFLPLSVALALQTLSCDKGWPALRLTPAKRLTALATAPPPAPADLPSCICYAVPADWRVAGMTYLKYVRPALLCGRSSHLRNLHLANAPMLPQISFFLSRCSAVQPVCRHGASCAEGACQGQGQGS